MQVQAFPRSLDIRCERPGTIYLGAAILVCGATGLVSVSPQPLLAFAAVVSILVGMVLPPRILSAFWGILLPIYALPGIDALWFDLARLGGAGLILVRCRPDSSSREMYKWTLPLWAVGALTMVAGMVTPRESPLPGIFAILSTCIALMIGVRKTIHKSVLVGFAVGTVASALVAILQVAELVAPAAAAGYGRFPGLSSSAPRASVEFAVACVLLFAWTRQKTSQSIRIRGASACAALIVLAALFASGGRTGLAGLGLAAILSALQRNIKPRHVAGVVACIAVLFYAAQKLQLTFATLDRVTGVESGSTGASNDVSNGRDTIFLDSMREFLQHPILGPGYNNFQEKFGIMPHFMPLKFAVTVGLCGAAVGIYLIVRLCALMFWRGFRAGSTTPAVTTGIAAIFLIMSLVEPDGPFIGVGLLTILFVISASDSSRAGQNSADAIEHVKPSAQPGLAGGPN